MKTEKRRPHFLQVPIPTNVCYKQLEKPNHYLFARGVGEGGGVRGEGLSPVKGSHEGKNRASPVFDI